DIRIHDSVVCCLNCPPALFVRLLGHGCLQRSLSDRLNLSIPCLEPDQYHVAIDFEVLKPLSRVLSGKAVSREDAAQIGVLIHEGLCDGLSTREIELGVLDIEYLDIRILSQSVGESICSGNQGLIRCIEVDDAYLAGVPD